MGKYFVFAWALLLAACSSPSLSNLHPLDASPDAARGAPCTAGMVVACPCLGTGQGEQTCNPMSGVFGACVCPGVDAGADVPGTDAPALVDAGVDVAPLDTGVDAPTTICTPGSASCASSTSRQVCNTDGLTYTTLACPVPMNASAACTSGACGFACITGYGDCNGLATDGCESTLATDVSNCGICAHACPSGQTCASGSCAAAILAPQQIAPLSTATVSSQNPTLRWTLTAGTSGVEVQICHDRACTSVEQTFEATGSSGRVPTALSAGVHFWRLYGRTSTASGAVPSPTWELFAGHRSAPVDRSWGSTLDVNGDGLADVAVGAPAVAGAGTGNVYVYLGSTGGLNPTPATTLTGPDGPGGYFGNCPASAGDVNGDGYSDLIVSADDALHGTGRAYVYLGGPSGLASTPATTLTGPDGAGGAFGAWLNGAGDLNGDGYADVIVGATNADSFTGRAYVFLGSAGGLNPTPSTTITCPDAGANFGSAVTGLGDINGDGFGDVAVGGNAAISNTGRAYIYLGSASGTLSTPATTLTSPDGNANFGWNLTAEGDLDGDGYADLVVGGYNAASGAGRDYVYLGTSSGYGALPSITLTGPGGSGGYFGWSSSIAGDANGDGYSDLVVGASHYASNNGQAYYFPGGPSGPASASVVIIDAPDAGAGYFGTWLVFAGDVNGDGYSDVMVGANDVLSLTGRTYGYLGGATGLAIVPAITWTGPGGVNGQFGWLIAMLDEFASRSHPSRG